MIKCEVIEDFSLREFAKLTNIVRKARNVQGKLFVGDTFECTENMADYLTGNNPLNKAVVKVIEIEQPKVKDAKIIEKVEDAIEGLDKKPKKKKATKKESK